VSKTPENATVRKYLDVGQNPPSGAIVTYYLKQQPAEIITLSFKDGQGNEIRTFKSKPTEQPEPAAAEGARGEPTAAAASGLEGSGEAGVAVGATPSSTTPAPKDEQDKELKIPSGAGWKRFVWDLNYAPATKVEGKDPPSELTIKGPSVAPGTYQVILTIGDRTYTESFTVICDPGAPASQEDMQAQHDLLMQIHQKIDASIKAVNRMRDLRQQLDGWSKRVEGLPNGKPIADTSNALKEKVLEIEKLILIPDLKLDWVGSYNYGVRLLEQLIALSEGVSLGNYRPTDASYDVFKHLSAKIDGQIDQFERLIETDLARINDQIAGAGIGAILPKLDRPANPGDGDGSAAAAPPSAGSSALPAAQGAE
jgi:hypothetical protein